MADNALLEERIKRLERSLQRHTWAMLCIGIVALALFAAGSFAMSSPSVTNELRTRRLVVVDEENRMRVEIGQDSETVDRYARAAGLTIYDDKGAERGGLATLSDGSAVLALDAPRGVGSSMPDRAGMKVSADGTAVVAVISNKGDFAAALQSDGAEGRVEVYKSRRGDEPLQARTLMFDGDKTESFGEKQISQ